MSISLPEDVEGIGVLLAVVEAAVAGVDSRPLPLLLLVILVNGTEGVPEIPPIPKGGREGTDVLVVLVLDELGVTGMMVVVAPTDTVALLDRGCDGNPVAATSPCPGPFSPPPPPPPDPINPSPSPTECQGYKIVYGCVGWVNISKIVFISVNVIRGGGGGTHTHTIEGR